MASTAAGSLDAEPLVRIVKHSGMLNRTLQFICSEEGVNKNGVKADLQQRIIERTSCREEPSSETLSLHCFYRPSSKDLIPG